MRGWRGGEGGKRDTKTNLQARLWSLGHLALRHGPLLLAKDAELSRDPMNHLHKPFTYKVQR